MRKRAALWRIGLDLLKDIHKKQFPKSRFGERIPETVVLGAAIALNDMGHTITATRVAMYLELPRETTRRRLNALLRKGLLAREESGELVLAPKTIKINDEAEATFMRQIRNM